MSILHLKINLIDVIIRNTSKANILSVPNINNALMLKILYNIVVESKTTSGR